MASRTAILVVAPILALGGAVAATRVVEADQLRSGRTSLYDRARAWQAAVGDARGTDPYVVSEFYAPGTRFGMPDPRTLGESRLETVSVRPDRRHGTTSHVLERRYGRAYRLERASLSWARTSEGEPWRIVAFGGDDDE